VNLRKPLCNLGSVLASEIHGARVVLQSCWILVADSVGAVVEVRALTLRARAVNARPPARPGSHCERARSSPSNADTSSRSRGQTKPFGVSPAWARTR
jgi:hypothetical protein